VVNDLLKLGVLPRKSKIIKFPKIPKKYLNHFIRGFLMVMEQYVYLKKYHKKGSSNFY
jgi:hypothetical protein